jgi:hypothetical protein
MKVGWLAKGWRGSQPSKARPQQGSKGEGWLVGCFLFFACSLRFPPVFTFRAANQPTNQPSGPNQLQRSGSQGWQAQPT